MFYISFDWFYVGIDQFYVGFTSCTLVFISFVPVIAVASYGSVHRFYVSMCRCYAWIVYLQVWRSCLHVLNNFEHYCLKDMKAHKHIIKTMIS